MKITTGDVTKMGNDIRRKLAILLLVGLSPLTTTSAAECTQWAAKIASVQGNIEAQRISSTTWLPVKRNDTFCAGDNIRSGDNSRAAIILANETLLRLNQNSAIKLTQFEKQTPSILELLKGLGHFISRVPRSLKIETATVNAVIEGTEFVVGVSDDKTEITVFEGKVLTQNQYGEVRITDGESVVAKANSAPLKTLLAKPRDTVQWALYFPPLLQMDKSDELSNASQLLYSGRVDEAQGLLDDMSSADALALQSIIAIVNNNKDTAFKLATDAVQQAPQSAASHIAMSYVWQAKLDLKQALNSIKQAVEHEDENAIAWARKAELQLSTGNLNGALASAEQATQLNPELSRTQSILGYAHLLRIDITQAIAAFEKAIELDQVDPLPRLGLGLAMIRKNNLTQGRRQIEIAASLDPNNSVIRSYLGKAYFEEKRGPLDADQFAMAKALDPNDPTPFYYDAIRKQSENNPVGALEDLSQSIELNDNRAVYRSSLQLDQDAAARSISLANIYLDLGFDQLALLEASQSLQDDPANSSALRFLSDSYSKNQRQEISRVSALLQSQLLQPLNAAPVQPHLRESNLDLTSIQGPESVGFNEFNPLFTKNQLNLSASVITGSNNLDSNETVVSGLYDRFAFSLGQFNYQTDGWRDNAELEHDISNAFIQIKAARNLDIQFEFVNRETIQGDRRMSLEPGFLSTNASTLDEETERFGLHYAVSPGSDLVFSYINNQREVILDQGIAPVFSHIETDLESSNYEMQYLLRSDSYNLIAGVGTNSVEGTIDSSLLVNGNPIPGFDSVLSADSEQKNAYLYSNITLNDANLLVGVSYDDIERKSADRTIEEVSPKLGLTWDVTPTIGLRLAAFETVKRSLTANQTIEPTEIAGFIQFYDTANETKSEIYGIGIDGNYSNKLYTGIELQNRDLDIPVTATKINSQEESSYRFYLNYVLSREHSLSLDYLYEEIENETTNPIDLETTTVPLSLIFSHSSGFFGVAKVTYIDQTGQFDDPVFVEYTDSFNLTDLSLGYRFPNQRGSFTLQINNLFDKEFTYQDLYPFRNDALNSITPYIPEINIYGKFTLNF